jgi:hypothetical protein
VSSSTHRHVELALQDAVRDYKQALNGLLQAMYADHASKGRLQSGATVRAAIRIMDDLACDAVQSTAATVRDISRDADAIVAFRTAMSDLIEFFRDEMPTVVRMASGRMPCEPNSSVEAAALTLFSEMESKIERKIGIAEFQLSPQPGDQTSPTATERISKTGRRPAPFWDDMWASIACDLYEGDLKPQTQADVELAMLRWIEDNGYSAAVSTVRARARRLWDLISAV